MQKITLKITHKHLLTLLELHNERPMGNSFEEKARESIMQELGIILKKKELDKKGQKKPFTFTLKYHYAFCVYVLTLAGIQGKVADNPNRWNNSYIINNQILEQL